MKGPEASKIKNIFSEVAGNYDVANDALTFGLARLWRKKLVKLSNTPKDGSVLDCATGTGDLAIDFKKSLGTKAQVTGIDFCKEMLDLAPAKAKKQNLDIKFELGDILDLQFEDQSFNTVSVAYGIRNVEDTKKGLEEMWRTLKPKGKLLILETGEGSGILNAPINFYTKYITPIVGGLVSKNKKAYSYLSTSSQAFPSKKNFLELGKNLTDLKSSSFKTLMFGASYIYIFEKK